jgi:hypothetical protein
MSDIVWEDPPEARHGGLSRFLSENTLQQLRSNPGRWAMVRTGPAEDRGKISSWLYGFVRRNPGFEGKERTANGMTRCYMRYVPEGDVELSDAWGLSPEDENDG